VQDSLKQKTVLQIQIFPVFSAAATLKTLFIGKRLLLQEAVAWLR
jgi:hypothetical protein